MRCSAIGEAGTASVFFLGGREMSHRMNGNGCLGALMAFPPPPACLESERKAVPAAQPCVRPLLRPLRVEPGRGWLHS